jgi:hypothetical protein
MTLVELYDHLMTLDWYYAMSDDPRAYRQGRESCRQAREAAISLGPEGEELFERFAAHYSLSPSDSPLPPRPGSGSTTHL